MERDNAPERGRRVKYPFSSKSVWSDGELLYNAGRYWNMKMVSVIERKKISR